MSEAIVVPWKGKNIRTYTEAMDAAIAIAKLKNKEKRAKEAKAFIDAYVKAGMKREIALSNLGYMAGYYNAKIADMIYQTFQASHPIFGIKHPTPEEAFAKGQKRGRKLKAKK